MNFIGHLITCVTTVKEVIDHLQKDTWDCVFLDHDLDGKTYVPSGPGTGYEVAMWLHEHPNNKPRTIIVHTLNERCWIFMKAALPEAIIRPGAWMYKYGGLTEAGL